jgi:NADPH-dependent curcumin reductase CurA
MKNNKIIFAKRPVGMPDNSCFEIIEDKIEKPNDGEVLLKTLYISVDPYIRGRMVERKSYIPPLQIGEVIASSGVAEVVESNTKLFKKGDYVTGRMNWEEYPIVNEKELRQIDPAIAPLQTHIGALGMTGLTAYFGIMDIGNPKPGETVVISGAAGAVGVVAGQIAKIMGCRVVGIAGSDEKAEYLVKELGFDAAINYKTAKDIREELKSACPDGIDIYFDNVGGAITDAALTLINDNARIPLCGQISHYNEPEPQSGPRLLGNVLIRAATIKGFLILQYASRFNEGIEKLAKWYKEGRIKAPETIVEGFENIPNAFIGLFTGSNLGKQIVKI